MSLSVRNPTSRPRSLSPRASASVRTSIPTVSVVSYSYPRAGAWRCVLFLSGLRLRSHRCALAKSPKASPRGPRRAPPPIACGVCVFTCLGAASVTLTTVPAGREVLDAVVIQEVSKAFPLADGIPMPVRQSAGSQVRATPTTRTLPQRASIKKYGDRRRPSSRREGVGDDGGLVVRPVKRECKSFLPALRRHDHDFAQLR